MGASANAVNPRNGWTPLHYSAHHNQPALLRLVTVCAIMVAAATDAVACCSPVVLTHVLKTMVRESHHSWPSKLERQNVSRY